MKFRSKDTNNIRIMSSLHVKSNEKRALLLTIRFNQSSILRRRGSLRHSRSIRGTGPPHRQQ